MIEVYTKSFDGVWFSVALQKQEILASSFGANQHATLSNVLGCVPFNVPFQVFLEPTVFAKAVLTHLKTIYDGKEDGAKFSLAMSHLPVYTQSVLKATAQIPPGYVASYGSIAKAAGGGARAVGNIMAANPFAPIVPCHRVVKSDFTLGGYGGGLQVKLGLLRREKKGFSEPREIDANDGQLTVFPVERVLKNFA